MTDKSAEKKRRILFAVLNWGLGHATRSIPLIRALKNNNEVILAATGRSLQLLRREFPDCTAINFPDYGVCYCRNPVFLFLYLLLQLPRVLVRLILENRQTQRIVELYKIDLIFSDNRYGVFARDIPSFLMTHQLRFRLPQILHCFEFISVLFNQLMFRRFRHVFIPDFEGAENLTGQLGHPWAFRGTRRLSYIGILSSIAKQTVSDPIDGLVMISGPEPQRTVLERLVLDQAKALTGHWVIVLGKPDSTMQQSTRVGQLDIYPHLNRSAMADVMNNAELIVARAGYSTIMELIALGKPALLIPTPGQTEQEYLGHRLMAAGWVHCVHQADLNLPEDIKSVPRSLPTMLLNKPVNDVTAVLSVIGVD
ncbi:MAG: glycosyltransferase [Fidelibacterota bacterium]